MSKTIDNSDLEKSELIPDNLLYEIFEVQYDDLFCKILKISEKSFAYFLQQQVIFNLLIIKKKVDPSILTAFQELFIKRYKENVKAMKKNYEIIKNKEKDNDESLIYLDITKCYIHCHKCYNIIHKCGSKLVLYNDYIFCIKCNNVYNKNQIMLFCPECKKNYFTKLRKPIYNGNKKFEKLFILKYKKYHCPSYKEEKVKCLKCSNNLYFRFVQNNPNNEEGINTIYCIKCKLKYNLKEVLFKCKICLKNFKCQPKIYRDFPNKKKKLLFLIHTLLRNKNALPNLSLCHKKCLCNIKDADEYKHSSDLGKYLEGIKNNKKTVVCNACFQILEYKEIIWSCPICGINFKYKKINSTKSKSKSKNIKNDNLSQRQLIEKNILNDNNKKKFPVSNISNIYQKRSDMNDYILKSEENSNKIKIKRIDKLIKKDFDININTDKLKTIFMNKNEVNTNQNKRSLIIVKSKSKNDIIRSNRRRNKKFNNQEQEKLNGINRININLVDNNSKEVNNNSKDLNEEKEKKINDTKSVFDKIKNNIFNLDEYYEELPSQQENKNKIRASGRYPFQNYNEFSEISEIGMIKPRFKNSFYLNKNGLRNGEIYNIENENGIIASKGKMNSEEFINGGVINLSSNKSKQIINNYEHLPIEKKNKKVQINFAKKIFFFNGKSDKDCRSYDENANININKFQTNDLFKRYMKYVNVNDNAGIQNNNYINNSEFYGNENNFSNGNYDNYYNYQDYGEEQINLYNFNSENYSIIKLLGKGSNGKIYLVQDLQTRQRFALKSMLIDNELELKQREEQYNLIYKITNENPELQIINIYGLEIRKVDRYNMFLNVLMEKGEFDWEAEILNRKRLKNYYTEQELYYILANLVGTFAYLQQKGISHRDVKPQNIICFGKNEYKICDFGEAKYQNDKKVKKYGNNLDISKQTIRGTEMYMSPILFKAVKFKPYSLTKYNSFKSDVFSLGLCFLYASSLDAEILFKVREILDMEKIGIIVNQYLGHRYSQEFINVLLYMLQVDENYRPDFIELNSWLIFGNY